MKRSEMIEVLNTAIESYDLPTQAPFCDYLLGQLEKAGMKPPLVYLSKEFAAGEEWRNAWEPEEDKIPELPEGVCPIIKALNEERSKFLLDAYPIATGIKIKKKGT